MPSNIYYKEGKNSKLVSIMFKKAGILGFLFLLLLLKVRFPTLTFRQFYPSHS